MFEPLRRGGHAANESSKTEAGLGLGLYIARQIVTAHGGTIELTSNDGDGTTVTVRLPRTVPPES
jgi:signal transduction histidine kinase